jgi:hypothetical protein
MQRPPERCNSYSRAEIYPDKYVDIACPFCKKNLGSLNRQKLSNALADPQTLKTTFACKLCRRSGFSLAQAVETARSSIAEGAQLARTHLVTAIEMRTKAALSSGARAAPADVRASARVRRRKSLVPRASSRPFT